MRAGDHFRCEEGELVVAGVEADGTVLCAGWPLGRWKGSEVSVTYSCTDAEHVYMVVRCRGIQESDARKRLAYDHNCDVCAAARAANPP